MILRHLSLTNFRNYSRLEIELPASIVLFLGDNGQGKSNLMEAVYFLATTRSPRTGSDRELIGWSVMAEAIPFARVAATIQKARGDLQAEIVIRADRVARPGGLLSEGNPTGSELSKRIKVNGVVRRALDLLGQVNVVMFSPQDLDLISGAPSLRRRYLDIAQCQVDPRYCRTLGQYNRVLLQRNHLLRQIRDGREPAETLEFWSDELARLGAYLLVRRLGAVASLNLRIDGYFRQLTGTGRTLKMTYRSSVGEATGEMGDGEMGERGGALTPTLSQGDRERDAGGERESTQNPELRTQKPEREAEVERQRDLFREGLRKHQKRELHHGSTLLGPHRDDVVFTADGIDMNMYGSRGEQRAVALALKLSEVEFMQETTGDRPILLLDDVMSELDPIRRQMLVTTLDTAGQVLISATDLNSFTPGFLERAAQFRIEQGALYPSPRPLVNPLGDEL